MEAPAEPLRCPSCLALIVDRRSPVCTTCHEALPEGWAMTPEQVADVTKQDEHARAEFNAAMKDLEPENDPSMSETTPEIDVDSRDV